MGKKDKKKGKGAEKTVLKTEKKAANKLKKELSAKGEEDIESLISQFVKEDSKRERVAEDLVDPPSFRSGASLCSNPEKDQLLLFGGEYFNGGKTFMYNDLFAYNIKKNNWLQIKCPLVPPPRCSHQAVTVSKGGGQMWIFGGEFASPTRSQFYHYKDLWVYYISEKRWEKISATGGPSARSGHRMVVAGHQLVVFGGFHENIRDYRYFNDVHIFDLNTYKWMKVEPSGIAPCPRSGCQVAAISTLKILVYGGYSREKVKKEVDRGIVHTDMFVLSQTAGKSGEPVKWHWSTMKQSGLKPSARCGFSITQGSSNIAYLFGGVCDEEEEEELKGNFFNDLYLLDLSTGHWKVQELLGKSLDTSKKKRRRKDKADDGTEEDEEVEDVEMDQNSSQLEQLNLEEQMTKTSQDGVFTVTVGASASGGATASQNPIASVEDDSKMFVPHSRMNALMTIKHGVLYLYGGIYEDGSRQFTFGDFYCLDIHKLDEWKTLVPLDTATLEWLESESEDSEEMSSDESCSDYEMVDEDK